MMSDLDGCTVTFDQTRAELEAIERRLANELGITRLVRRALIERDRAGKLGNSDLAADWRAAYSSFLDWVRADPPRLKPLAPTRESKQEEAAQAASALLYPRC